MAVESFLVLSFLLSSPAKRGLREADGNNVRFCDWQLTHIGQCSAWSEAVRYSTLSSARASLRLKGRALAQGPPSAGESGMWCVSLVALGFASEAPLPGASGERVGEIKAALLAGQRRRVDRELRRAVRVGRQNSLGASQFCSVSLVVRHVRWDSLALAVRASVPGQ